MNIGGPSRPQRLTADAQFAMCPRTIDARGRDASTAGMLFSLRSRLLHESVWTVVRRHA
jgi:hypothetical protein